MPAATPDPLAVPRPPTSVLDELESELGQVEWLGHRLRERAQDSFFAAARRHEPSVWQHLLSWTH